MRTARRDVARLVNDKTTGLPFDSKADRTQVADWLTGVLDGADLTPGNLTAASLLVPDPVRGLPDDWADYDLATVSAWLEDIQH